MIRPQLSPQGPHHPNRCSLFFRRIPPAPLVMFFHDTILVSRVRDLEQTQGGSGNPT